MLDYSRRSANGHRKSVNGTSKKIHTVSVEAEALLPTEWGEFSIRGFLDTHTGSEHTAIVQGDVRGRERVPVRVHSQCHTGDVLGSLRCDCRAQLEFALEYISGCESGVVIYLQQEGRGIGLVNKLKAYHLQDLGMDTVDANLYLGFPSDARTYETAAEIINELDIRSIELMTNNPGKLESLERLGIAIEKRIPVVIESNKHNRTYLETKRRRMGHLI